MPVTPTDEAQQAFAYTHHLPARAFYFFTPKPSPPVTEMPEWIAMPADRLFPRRIVLPTAEFPKKANAAAAQGGADAVGQVITVSNTAIQSIGRTVSAAGNLGGELKQVTKAASGITAALGDSVPIIGQIGSALSSVVSGPLGIISAAIGAATFAIKKLIEEAEARVARIRASADAVTSASMSTPATV